jgi:hypothetical protein
LATAKIDIATSFQIVFHGSRTVSIPDGYRCPVSIFPFVIYTKAGIPASQRQACLALLE